ncbi:MAG: MFS transporter [Ancalomicrobiaceae bacterium]|nr:MFS transporter [Ancalomicrobiaceae bacterium]
MTAVASGAQSKASAERLAVSAIFVACGIGTGAWAASIPLLKANLALSDGELGIGLFGFAAGSVASMQVAAYLTRLIGTAAATRASAIVFALAIMLPAFGVNLASFTAMTFVFGATMGLIDVTMNVYASELERRWGAAIMSSFHAGFSGGGLAGAALGAALTFAGPFVMLAGGSLVVAVLTVSAWRFLRVAEVHADAHAHGSRRLGAVMLALCVAAFLCFMCEGAMADWTAVYLMTVAGVSVSAAVSGFAAFSLTMLVGRLVGDACVRQLGRARVVGLGGALAAAGLALAVAMPTLVPASIGFALVGVGLSNVVPVVFSASSNHGSSPAAGLAMAATAGYAGFLIGPVIIGFVAQGVGLRLAIALLIACAGTVALTGIALRAKTARS